MVYLSELEIGFARGDPTPRSDWKGLGMTVLPQRRHMDFTCLFQIHHVETLNRSAVTEALSLPPLHC